MYLFNGAGREVYLSHVLCGIETELVALRATLYLPFPSLFCMEYHQNNFQF